MPERPSSVPEEAFWSADENEWCLAERDGDDEFHGVVKWWRPDGTLCCQTDYVHGTPHGKFTRFHENGEVSRSGGFEDGELHGTNIFFRSTAETTENFPHGLGDAIGRAEMDYDTGSIVAARCYDRDGRQCMEDGAPFPDNRPTGVPDDAHFRKREADGEYRWVAGAVVDNGDGTIARTGTWRFWTKEGVLVADETYAEGELDGIVKVYDEDSGALLEEVTYRAGEKHGPSRTLAADGTVVSEETYDGGDQKGPFSKLIPDEDRADDGVVRVRGTLVDDDEIGVVEYLDAGGKVVASVDTGSPPELEATQSVLGANAGFAALSKDLLAKKQIGASIFAMTRAVGRGEAKPEELSTLLARFERPASHDAASTTQYAKMLVSNIARFGGGPDKCLSNLFDGIRKGGLGYELIRHSAGVLDDMGEPKLALELVDAAVAGDPSDAASYEYTRALVRASLGDAVGAKASAKVAADAGPSIAQGLSTYMEALFPKWDFWPARDSRLTAIAKLRPLMTRVESRRAIDVAVVRDAIQKCATRLVRHRERLIEVFGARDYIVPDLSHLLPDGPVECNVPDSYGGIGIHHLARQDWTRLTWICWLAGLNEIALPDELGPPVEGVPVYLVGHARFYMVHEADPKEVLGNMIGKADFVADENREKLVAAAAEAAAATDWFGMPVPALEEGFPDISFVREDETAFVRALSFFTTPGYDLFGEASDDEDEDEDESDDEDESEGSDDEE